MRTFWKPLYLLLPLYIALGCPALADEWGYEGEPELPSPYLTPPPPPPGVHPSKPSKAAQAQPQQPAQKLPSPQELKAAQAAENWLKLYTLVAPNELTPEQHEQLRKYIEGKLSSGQQAEYLAITDYWPAVQKALDAGTDPKNSYRDLFRALLRLEERNLRASEKNVADADVIAEVLGPARIAVSESPPLTEDSINAYADMACFLYEQKNPGRTLDATDNRTLFARMISDKFKDAPTKQDKLAMINFDVSWAKLKVIWLNSDFKQRQQLLEQWANPSATMGGVKSSPTLEAVLKHGPWSLALASLRASRLEPQPKAGAGQPNRISSSTKHLVGGAK